MRIAIALFPDVEELDVVGPWEVLSWWARQYPDDGVEVFTVSEDLAPITCAKGMRILPDRAWGDTGTVDVLVFAGGIGTRRLLGDERVRDRVRGVASDGALMTSVCTGALVCADAGLLDGRPATTYSGALDLLASLGAGIDVRPDERFVDSGDVITAAGVSAGIDMALHLVARLHSVERDREIRRGIQYDPEPPV